IVATVSAIYGLGDPVEYRKLMVTVRRGEQRGRDDILSELVRIQYARNDVARISKINPLTGDTIATVEQCSTYPAKHFVTERPKIERAVSLIRSELAERLAELKGAGKLLEAQRLESRTNFDVEMMLEIGTCAGIENYSRHLSSRSAGERP